MKNKRLIGVIIGILALLSIPLLLNWPWTGSDFVFMGVLLGAVGLGFEFVMRKALNTPYKYGALIAIGASFLLVWVNAAVGIIGEGPVNMMYPFVVLAGIICAIGGRFRPLGMARTLFIMAAAQFVIPIIAFIVWGNQISWLPHVPGVFFLNSFFVVMFLASGMLFRWASNAELK